MPDHPHIEFSKIVAHGGAQTAAFEEYCAQLARHVDVPDGSIFQRNGRGADLGVECLWELPDKTKWGWQAKFVFELDALKAQTDQSFDSALKGHPTLTRYFVCFPFDASAAPGRGKSQQEKLREYKNEWESMAATQGRSVSVHFWAASELTERLLAIDVHGGRRMFWFGEPVLTPRWFSQHISVALKVAGPRYTPALRVKHPVASVLDAFGATNNWEERLRGWQEALVKSRDNWKRSVGAASSSDIAEFPKTLLPTSQTVLGEIDELISVWTLSAQNGRWDDLRRRVVDTRAALDPVLKSLQAALDTTHGEGASRSKRFREFQAEYQAVFPARYYDSANEISLLLRDLAEWLDSVEVRATSSGVLLITGPAGIGKTHSLCDVAASRDVAQPKLFSVLLFGARFGPGIVWDQIRVQLGLDARWTEDALFAALDAAAEASGRPVIIFIDALNESQPRTLWRSELSALVAKVRQHPSLRLCVTCRTDYAAAVVDPTLDIPRFEHPGFAGNEFDACRSFFEFYELDPPIGPLLDPEFANPLFLKLTCEALRAENLRRLPAGWSGFRTVFRAVLERQDRDWCAETGVPLRNAITLALEIIATDMARRSRRAIPLPEARALISSLGVDGDGLLRRLLDQQLLMAVPVVVGPNAGMLSDMREELTFAYERLGDHLQVQAALRAVGSGPIPKEMVELALAEPGYAEALSIQLPEVRAQELMDIVSPEDQVDMFGPWLHGLQWRDVNAITEHTEQWLRSFLDLSKKTWFPIFDTLLVIAVRPGHHLDRWFSAQLSSLKLPDRDAFWCTYLHHSWEEQTELHPVRRLIDSVWAVSSESVDSTVVVSWLRVLCWFFAAADRRVRDRASRAAVLLAQKQPSLWATITEEMQSVDDDYVLERVLACAYGTHLRGDDGPALAALAKIVAPMLTNDVRANALIRDHARCICDLALRRGLDVNFTSEQLQPPFGSEWPLRIPTEEDLSLFKTSEARREHPNLYESTIDDFRGDFAIYTVPHVIRPYKDSVDGAAASRWIFQQVLDFGYTPERFRGYDAYMIGKFGGGRGRPKWAERIGKKYQWIALARLLGRLADHVRPNEEDWEDSIPKTLTAQSLRDLDVSADGLPAADEIEYKKDDSDLTTNKPSLDEQWVVDAGEVSTIEDSLWDYRKGDGEIWFPLEAHVSYVDGHVRPGDLGFRRQIWLQCRSYLVPKNDFQRLWNWMRSKNFMGRWMPEGQTIYNNVFVGEYPRGLSLGNDGMPDRRAEPLDGIRCSVIPTTHDVTPEFTEDSSGVPRLRLTVPVPQLLEGRRWNGRGGYLDGAGQLVFVDPSAEHDGINGCFVRQQELQTYLNKHDLSVVWTVLAEKLPGNYETVRRLEYSHIRGLHEGTVRSARDPVITRR